MIIALLNSAVSMYYYLRVVKVMYLNPASDESRVRVPLSLGAGGRRHVDRGDRRRFGRKSADERGHRRRDVPVPVVKLTAA